MTNEGKMRSRRAVELLVVRSHRQLGAHSSTSSLSHRPTHQRHVTMPVLTIRGITTATAASSRQDMTGESRAATPLGERPPSSHMVRRRVGTSVGRR